MLLSLSVLIAVILFLILLLWNILHWHFSSELALHPWIESHVLGYIIHLCVGNCKHLIMDSCSLFSLLGVLMACVYVPCTHMYVCRGIHEEDRGQLLGVSSFLLPCGSLRTNSGGQVWWPWPLDHVSGSLLGARHEEIKGWGRRASHPSSGRLLWDPPQNSCRTGIGHHRPQNPTSGSG